MTRKEVYQSIASKASNQWFYRRLLSRLNAVEPDVANKFLDRFADCDDVIDVIRFWSDGDDDGFFYTN